MIWLDNPRSEREIRFLSEYIQHSQQFAKYNDPIPSLNLTLPLTSSDKYSWTDVKQILLQSCESKQYPKEFLRSLEQLEPLTVIAQNLVVIRFEDFGFIDYNDKHGSELHNLDQDSETVKKYIQLFSTFHQTRKNIISASYLISMLYFQEAEQSTFLLHVDDEPTYHYVIDQDLNVHLFWWALSLRDGKHLDFFKS